MAIIYEFCENKLSFLVFESRGLSEKLNTNRSRLYYIEKTRVSNSNSINKISQTRTRKNVDRGKKSFFGLHFIAGVSNPRPAGRMWPSKPFGATREGIFNLTLHRVEILQCI